MKTLLIFPPVWECSSPYPSLAVLAAYLKMKNIKVDVMDLNIEVQHMLFSDLKFMDIKIENLKNKIKYEQNQDFVHNAKLCIWMYEHLKEHLYTDVISCIKNSKDEFEETKYKFICNYLRFIYSADYYPSTFSDLKYVSPYALDNLKDVFFAVEDRQHNIFYEILRKQFLDSICEYDIIGLSIASFNQLVPALTLAGLIKKKDKSKQIILGGAIVPYIEKAIYHNDLIFSYVDYILTGEGETALYNCIQFIEGNKEITLSNAFYYDYRNKCVQKSELSTIEEIDLLPCPDYSQYPLDKYFCRKLMMSYVSSRGCFWNKCSFCSLTCSYGNRYRERSMIKVIEDLKSLEELYHIDRISFNDEALTAKRITMFAKEKIKNNLSFKWSCLARLNNYYNKEDLKLANNAGLYMMSVGLESGSQHVLDGMRKGLKIYEIPDVLKDIHNANIWVNAYYIIGFLNETHELFEEGLAFLKSNIKHIDSLCYTYFRLEDNSYIYNNPSEYGISIQQKDADYFGPSYEFTSEIITDEVLNKRHSMLCDFLRDKRCYAYNIYFDFDTIFSFMVENRRKELNDFIQGNISKSKTLFRYKDKNFENTYLEVNSIYRIYSDRNIICALNMEKCEMYNLNTATYNIVKMVEKYHYIEKVLEELIQKYPHVDIVVLKNDLIRIVTQLADLELLNFGKKN